MNSRGSTAIFGPRRRVAHVIHSLGSGGAETVLLELAGSADAAGVELVVIGLSDAADNRTAVRLRAAGVTVHELHAGRYDTRTVLRLRDLLRAERVDLVHTHLKHADLVGGAAARLVGLPAVSTLHLIEPAGGLAQRARVQAAVQARRRLFARVIAVSTAQRDWYAGLAGSGDRLVVLPNGVADPGEPCQPGAAGAPGDGSGTAAQLREELQVPPGALLALTVSLLRPEKGHAVLLEAIRRHHADLPPMIFALAGDGPLQSSIAAEVEQDPVLRERVRLLGYRTDVNSLLQAADLVVHPSREDALPTALISALANGRPVVATAVGGIRDIVTADCGRLVPKDDPDALAASIGELAADATLRQRLGRAGRERFLAGFSAEVWARRLRTLYDGVLVEHRRAPELRVITSPPAKPDRPVRRVAVLSTVSLDPPDNGKSVVINGFLRHLVDRVGRQNVHYLHVGEPLQSVPAELEGVRVHELGRPARTEQLRGMLVDVALRGHSLQEACTSSRRVADAVSWTLAALQPDLVLIDTLRMAQHVRPDQVGDARRVLYLDDLFSVRYRRMLGVLHTADSGFDPLGQFASFVPGPLQRLTRWPVSRDALLRFEARRVAASEVRAAAAADTSILLNRYEAEQLSSAIGAPVAVVPPLVPLPPRRAGTWSGRADFAFVGLMSIPHNHDGLIWFLTEVFGSVLAHRPDARLHLIGRGAGEEIRRAASRWGDHVVLHGFVDDLDALLPTMAALINPLRFGSGIKIKTLDALSRGLPVVTTTIGAEGIVEESRPGIRIADDAATFADQLARAADLSARAAASADATAFYAERFAPDAAAVAYDRALGTSPRLFSTAANSPAMKVSGEK